MSVLPFSQFDKFRIIDIKFLSFGQIGSFHEGRIENTTLWWGTKSLYSTKLVECRCRCSNFLLHIVNDYLFNAYVIPWFLFYLRGSFFDGKLFKYCQSSGILIVVLIYPSFHLYEVLVISTRRIVWMLNFVELIMCS